MKILTFTSLFPNVKNPWWGVFVLQRMAHVANRSGNSVTAVAPLPYLPSLLASSRWGNFAGVPRQEELGKLRIYHPRYPHLPKISMPLQGFSMFIGSLPLLMRLHREHKFDVIDAHYVYPDGLAAILAGMVLRVPVVVSARGTDIYCFPSFRLIKPMISWTLRQAEGIIAVSTFLKELIVKLGIPANKVQVIGNGVDPQRFFPTGKSESRGRLGIPRETKMLLAVARLDQVKGLQLLLPAVRQISASQQNIALYLIGDGPQRQELEKMADRLGLRNQVHFVGVRANEELKYWYSAADVSCLMSSREGWPNVLLESLACGTPVVASNIEGVRDVIISEDLGLLVERSPGSIAEGVNGALRKVWCPEKLVSYARSRTWELIGREVDEYLSSKVVGLNC